MLQPSAEREKAPSRWGAAVAAAITVQHRTESNDAGRVRCFWLVALRWRASQEPKTYSSSMVRTSRHGACVAAPTEWRRVGKRIGRRPRPGEPPFTTSGAE